MKIKKRGGWELFLQRERSGAATVAEPTGLHQGGRIYHEKVRVRACRCVNYAH